MTTATRNAMQRSLCTLSHQEPDKVPLFLGLSMHGAQEAGVPLEKYFLQARYVIEGQCRLQEKYHGDALNPVLYSALETEAWGGTTIFRNDGPPQCGAPVIRMPEQIDSLRVPSLDSAEGLQRELEIIVALKQRYREEIPMIGMVISPFSVPIMQMGFGPYLELLYLQPERWEHLMQLNTEFCIQWANAQLEAGATAICYADPMASTGNIPRELYLRTGYKVLKNVLSGVHGSVAIHLASGRGLEIAEELIASGVAGIGVSGLESLATWKSLAKGRVAVMGNLNGITMRRWTPAQAETEVRRAIAAAGPGGGFILSDNHGEIPLQVSEEVLIAMREAVDRWGRYPLDWIENEAGSEN